MHRAHLATLMGVLALIIAACAADSVPLTTTPPSEEERREAAVPTSTEVPPLPDVGPARTEYETFDPDNFSNPAVIDNQWLPLTPGTRLTFEGTTEDEGELIEHQVISIVTDLTKVIDGIETRVLWDLDYSDGNLAETELAFFAQDDDGAVWRMGEHPEEYEAGAFVDAPTWLAGLAAARPGIAMPADPFSQETSYSQGWGPAVEFIDRAMIGQTGQEDCVPTGCYENVLIVDEFNVEEPGAFQHKYFAPGIGNIRVHWSGTDESHEELELVSIETLSPAEMDEVRAAALELEAHAYQISPDLYGLTEPILTGGETASVADDASDEASGEDAGEAEPAPADEGSQAAFVFDPLGDRVEHDEEVGLAFDGDPGTAWTTETYEAPLPTFKAGVGLAVENTGSPSGIDVAGLPEGTAWEVRWAAEASDDLADWSVIAGGTAAGETVSVDLDAQDGGVWLIWLTDLPSSGQGTYAAAIAEITFSS